MFRHTIKLAFRSYLRHKGTFLINIISLSTGLACALFIFLWVNDEIGINKFHENSDRLYRVMQNYEFPQGIKTTEMSPALLASTMKDAFTEIEDALPICNLEERTKGIMTFGAKEMEGEGLYAGANFFDVLSYELIDGTSFDVLNTKNKVVLSEALALKLFNTTENLIGQTVAWSNQWWETSFQISGIFKAPSNSSIPAFDFIISFEHLLADEDARSWYGDYAETFVVLHEDVEPVAFNTQIRDFLKGRTRSEEFSTLFLEQFSKSYLYGNYQNGYAVGGRIAYVRLFSIIALLILILACVNFMNLSTAQASIKMKEIGVKKTIGADRGALITQFLGESLFLSILSLGFALFIVIALLPQFNHLTGKQLQFILDQEIVFSIIAIVLFTGLFAGSYPAFYLSNLNPQEALKNKQVKLFNTQWIRKGLVVFQFTLSVVFIISVLVIHQQIDFIQTKNLGFDRDNVLSFERVNFREQPEVFMASLKNIPGVINASSMFDNILSGAHHQSSYSWRGEKLDEDFLFKSPIISYDVMETLDMKLLAGRSYSKDFKEEKSKIVINEATQKLMGLEDPVGQVIKYAGGERQIIGVVRDFNYGSIHHKIEPLIFRFTENGSTIMVKIKAGMEQETIAQIEAVYKTFHPKYPFKFSFLNEDYQRQYVAESRVASLSKIFSLLAILISCLGLFGLATFTAERRQKEIGIRKVLGASVEGLVYLLSREFLKPVFIAFLIASPIAWYSMQSWLQNFAYSITLNGQVFIIAGVLAMGIAALTVGFQSIRTAIANPVESLRNE